MKITYTITLLLILSSCTNIKKSYHENLKASLVSEFGNVFKDYDFIIIIPNSGCTGCINDAEEYLKRNLDNYNILFILTKISSIKSVKLKLQLDLDHPNLYIDNRNLFCFDEYQESIYPIIVNIENSKIADIKPFENII